MKAIAKHPPAAMYQSGLEIDCQCARCGSSMNSERCDECEDGYVDDGQRDDETCFYCDGTGTVHTCCSSPDWCNDNPLPGREQTGRGQIEWFTIEQEQANG